MGKVASTSRFPSPPFPRSLVLSLGLGLGFGSLLLIPPQTLKPLSSTVNVAAAAVKAAAALRSPPSAPGAILLTSKALLKTYKLLTPRSPSPFPAAAKPLKSYLAAINLARYAPPVLISRSLGFTSGYKISKNLARVLEGLVGLQIDSAIRGRVGLLVKAVIIVKEIERQFCSRVRFGIVRVAGLRRRVCVSSCRSEVDCGVVPAKHFVMEEMMGAKPVEIASREDIHWAAQIVDCTFSQLQPNTGDCHWGHNMERRKSRMMYLRNFSRDWEAGEIYLPRRLVWR